MTLRAVLPALLLGPALCLLVSCHGRSAPSPDSAEDLHIGLDPGAQDMGHIMKPDASLDVAPSIPDVIPPSSDSNTPSCGDLNKAYAAAVLAAKKCCPVCAVIQCTMKVKAILGWPHETFVNGVNSSSIKTMQALAKEWKARKCTNPNMPGPVYLVNYGACSSTGGSASAGLCKDIWR